MEAAAKPLHPGSRVVARFGGGAQWFPAAVTKVHKGGEGFDLTFDDGDFEAKVPRNRIELALPNARAARAAASTEADTASGEAGANLAKPLSEPGAKPKPAAAKAAKHAPVAHPVRGTFSVARLQKGDAIEVKIVKKWWPATVETLLPTLTVTYTPY
jgi:biotin carboxyl carrier protein